MADKATHSKHKERLRERFINSTDFVGFSEHEILEMMLNYVIVRKNTNDIAHKLIEKFGSLNNVLIANVGELTSVDGVGERTAVFLNMQYSLMRYYNSKEAERAKLTGNIKEDVLKRLKPLFDKSIREEMYVVTVTNKNRIKRIKKVAEGTISSVTVTPRDLVRACIEDNDVVSVIIAHNHPGGRLSPSQEDLNFTRLVEDALHLVDLKLLEHYIICDDSYYPIIESNILKGLRK